MNEVAGGHECHEVAVATQRSVTADAGGPAGRVAKRQPRERSALCVEQLERLIESVEVDRFHDDVPPVRAHAIDRLELILVAPLRQGTGDAAPAVAHVGSFTADEFVPVGWEDLERYE